MRQFKGVLKGGGVRYAGGAGGDGGGSSGDSSVLQRVLTVMIVNEPRCERVKV